VPRVAAREREGPEGRERECVACLFWWPLRHFKKKSGYRLRTCNNCRAELEPSEHERHGEAAMVPTDPPHVAGKNGGRSIRIWFETNRTRVTVTIGRYWEGALVSSASVSVATARRALKIAASWSGWLYERGEPLRLRAPTTELEQPQGSFPSAEAGSGKFA
jgi:hypothetical protein